MPFRHLKIAYDPTASSHAVAWFHLYWADYAGEVKFTYDDPVLPDEVRRELDDAFSELGRIVARIESPGRWDLSPDVVVYADARYGEEREAAIRGHWHGEELKWKWGDNDGSEYFHVHIRFAFQTREAASAYLLMNPPETHSAMPPWC